MFDFQATLDEADQANVEGNYALAVFDYWLIEFAFYELERKYMISVPGILSEEWD